jgi:hypothetical protein
MVTPSWRGITGSGKAISYVFLMVPSGVVRMLILMNGVRSFNLFQDL